MSNHNIRITISDQLTTTLQGKFDKYIMKANSLKGYSTQQQKDLNLIRIFLQVTTLSDMVDNMEPTKIPEWALNGTRYHNFSQTRHGPDTKYRVRHKNDYGGDILSSQEFLRYGCNWRAPPKATVRELKQAPDLDNTPHANNIKCILYDTKHLPRYKKRLLSHVIVAIDEDTIWREYQRKQTLTIA